MSISERSPSVSSGRVTRTETLWGFIQSEEQQSTSKNADCDIDHLAECSLSATIGEIGLLHRYDEIMPLGIWMCLSPIIQNYQNGHSGGETHGFGIEHFKKGPYMSVHIYIYRVSLWCMALSMPSWYKASEQAQGATSFCPTRRSTSPGSAQDQRHQEDLPGPRFTLRLGSKELVKVGLSQYLEIFHLIRSRLRIYKRKETFLRVLRSPDLSGGLRRKRTCR